MKARWYVLSVMAIVLLLGLPTPARGGETTTCGGTQTVLVPDGRIVESIIPGSTTFWFEIHTSVGRSYSVEIRSKTDNTFPGTLTLFNPTDACSGTSTLATTLTTNADPKMSNTGRRRSFTALGSFHRASLANSSGTGFTYTISVSETTMFSPGWSTFGNFQTFWSFLNTTDDTINGTLTLLDATGNQVATVGLAILSNRAAFPSTLTMGIAAGQSGTARFIHDGPPGAVLAEGAITNFAGHFQRVRFEPPREQR